MSSFRGNLRLRGGPAGYQATLYRCGASKNKPFCDDSHHDVKFTASGEPETGTQTDMLVVCNGLLAIEPQPSGPLEVSGNLEITSGTGRMVAPHPGSAVSLRRQQQQALLRRQPCADPLSGGLKSHFAR